MTSIEFASDLLRSRHLTIPAVPGISVLDAAKVAYAELATRLRDEIITPVQEKLYGPLADKDAILRVRREALHTAGLDADTPCTFTAGRRDEDLGFAGVQLWGLTVRPKAPIQVETVESREGSRGRLVEGKDFRLLCLAGVHGNHPGDLAPPGVAAQAHCMFENADAALRQQGFAFRDVARTWIYVARILDWYGELNRVRAEFLRTRGIVDDATYPASTGIQGSDGTGECLMDVLAVDGEGAKVRAITESSRQKRPMAYGSSFSRGLALRCGGEASVFVSGTASIDSAGQTLHCGQREAQILETLLSISALLEDQGTGLADIALATLFCKDRETLGVFERVTRQLGITRLPVIPVLADVCRPELMVEIEALAIVPEKGAAATEAAR